MGVAKNKQLQFPESLHRRGGIHCVHQQLCQVSIWGTNICGRGTLMVVPPCAMAMLFVKKQQSDNLFVCLKMMNDTFCKML